MIIKFKMADLLMFFIVKMIKDFTTDKAQIFYDYLLRFFFRVLNCHALLKATDNHENDWRRQLKIRRLI